MDDDANYHHPTKPFSSNRRSSHYHRTPPPNRYDVDDDVIDDDLDEEMAEQPYRHHHSNQIRSFDAAADDGWEWHPKKRKLKILDHSGGSGYELAPRGRNPGRVVETDHAVFVLLEVWGDRFLQLGRKSLMSEDWGDVAAKVSEELKTEMSEKECRGMLDMLKRRYMKEKARIENGGVSRWEYYKKMDMLMEGSTRQELGLACGVDNGEYVFMNTRVYLEKSNGVDEMMDSPGESESDDDDEEEDENENVGRFNGFKFAFPKQGGGEGSYRVLAESIQKFGEIYESIESSKRQQMMELEKMRREVNREMEAQKKEILERAQAEIAKIQEAADDDGDDDGEDDDEEEEEEDSEEASAEELTE